MHMSVDLNCSTLLKSCEERTMLSINNVKTDLNHFHIENSICYTYFSLNLVEFHHYRMLSCVWIDALKNCLLLLGFLLLECFLCTASFSIFSSFLGLVVLLSQDVSFKKNL